MMRLTVLFAALLGWVASCARGVLTALVAAVSIATQALAALLAFVVPPMSWVVGATGFVLRAIVVTPRYTVTTVAVGATGFIALSAFTNPNMKEELSYAHDRSSAIEILDADGRWLGIVPPATFTDWSDGKVLPADHEALPLAEVPPVWRTCIVHLEDREFYGVSRWLGINPIAIVKSGWQTVTGDRRRGASTLYMQVVRTLRGQMPDRREAPGEILVRKIAELLGANALVKVLAERDPAAAERFVAMHLPLVIGAGGSGFGVPAHGIGLASRLLFGVPAEKLSIVQQAILAAAVKTPILMALATDVSGQVRAEARWKRVKERADFCLREAPGLDADAASDARLALAAMPLPVPHIDPDLRPLLPKDPTAAWRVTVSPARRALYFARNELSVAKHEIDAAVGTDWRGRVVSIRLSTSAVENRAFVDAALYELNRMERSLPGLALSLTNKGPADRQAHVVVACADDRGKLRRIYSSHEGLFWTRKAPVGSVAKMVAAVALGRRDTPTTGYCRAPIPGLPTLQDQGMSCSVPSAWIAARDAFARSNNQAIHWALRNRVSNSVLMDVARALRLPSFGDVPASTALTLGTFEMTPAEMLRLARAIGGGIAGSEANSALPSVLTSVTLTDREGHASEFEFPIGSVISGKEVRPVFPPSVKSYVAGVLSATSDNGGTLQRLKPVKQMLAVDLYAKTGTVSVGGDTRALHVLGTAEAVGGNRAIIASVSAQSDPTPIGRFIVSSQLQKLFSNAICGARVPRARLRPPRLRTTSFSSRYSRNSFLWFTCVPSRFSIRCRRR